MTALVFRKVAVCVVDSFDFRDEVVIKKNMAVMRNFATGGGLIITFGERGRGNGPSQPPFGTFC